MPKGVYKRIKPNIWKGKKHSKESRAKMRLSHLGKYIRSPEGRESFTRKMSGANSTSWKGGVWSLNKAIRGLFKYRQWRSDVFERDNWTCQHCGKRGGKIQPHHIKQFSDILYENNIKTIEQALDCEELWNINNGQTLCIPCHIKTDTYGKKSK
jgi:hypothetical protein